MFLPLLANLFLSMVYVFSGSKITISAVFPSEISPFSIPMILGDLLQQCYNIVDTLIVGQFLGKNALASVGSSFTLMTFITSIILGLCMGSGALFSIRYGQKDEKGLREDVCASFFFIALITFILTVISYIFLKIR